MSDATWKRTCTVVWLNNKLHASTDMRGPMDAQHCTFVLTTSDRMSPRWREDHMAMLLAMLAADLTGRVGTFIVDVTTARVERVGGA